MRSAIVGAGALVVGSFLLYPFVADSAYANNSEFNQGTIFLNSHGASKILRWLVNGGLFDHGRFPIVTILVFVGIGVSAVRVRHDDFSRAILAFFALSLALFFGRPTWGGLLAFLPAGRELLFHRFISGVHLGGLFLAAIGSAWLLQRALAAARDLRVRRARAAVATAVVGAVAVAALMPALLERKKFDELDVRNINYQRNETAHDGADLERLIQQVKGFNDGRAYAGLLANWGSTYKVGEVLALEQILRADVDLLGFSLRTLSLNSDVEARFDESNPFHYKIFGVRYLIYPQDRQPPVPADLLDRAGRHTLWRVRDGGTYIDVVDSGPAVTADRNNVSLSASQFMAARTPVPYPLVAYDGQDAATPTAPTGLAPAGPAGRVDVQVAQLDEGRFTAQLVAGRNAVAPFLGTQFDRGDLVWVAGRVERFRDELQLELRENPARHRRRQPR